MEWFGSPSRRMVMRLSLAVSLTDDLTGVPVLGSNARVWIEGEKPPIKKNDGRSIFVDLEDGEYTVNAEGGIYAKTSVKCRITTGKAESLTIRLLPNSVYPVPGDAVRIEGKAEPGALIRVFSAEKTTAYKLLADAAKGSSEIGIYHPVGINIEGKLLKIMQPGKNGEFIRIRSVTDSERSVYALTQELNTDFPKIGTMIVPVSECSADSSGNFMLLLRNVSGTQMTCEAEGAANISKTVDISGSKYIKTDLTQ